MNPDSQTLTLSIVRYMYEHAPVLLMQFDGDGRLVAANTYTEQLAGHGVGLRFEEAFVDFSGTLNLDDLAATEASRLLDLCRPSGAPVTHVCYVDRVGDGYLICGAVDMDEAGRLQEEVLALNRELNDTTRQLHKSNGELEVLNRLKNHFLGMAAHDLRKPVGVISTYTGFVLDEAGETLHAEHRGFLETVQDMSRSMSRLIDDFLDVSMIESGELNMDFSAASLRDVVGRVCTLTEPTARRHDVTLETDQAADVPMLVMDAERIEQVIANLTSNAIEHSAPGSFVTIRTHLASNETVAIEVIDRGDGIPDEQRRTLFDAFSRGRTRKAGAERSIGLGLMISRQIVDAHGGRIEVESKAGRGSTFAVHLPTRRNT